MRRVVRWLLVVLCLLVCPAGADAKWTRVQSEHFVFVGDASERDIRKIAERLEQFRAVVGELFSAGVTRSPVRTVVLVFQNDRSFTPFKPLYQGRPRDLAAYFIKTDDVNYIALNAEQDSSAYGVIFHEYAHFIVANAVGPTPPWVNEGLAEFYQTFQARSDGRSVVLGTPQPRVHEMLANSTLIPLEQLTAVDFNSPMYNEGNRRNLFYAQSWALVHYLTFSGPQRTAQLKAYLRALRAGVPSREAFEQSFGDPATLERELGEYVRRLALSAVRLEFDQKILTNAGPAGTAIPDHEATAYLADLLAHLQRQDEARALLRKVTETNKDAGRALAVLGALEVEAGNPSVGLSMLERAVALIPDAAEVQTAYGRALLAETPGREGNRDDRRARARAALSRALALAPDDAPTAVALAGLEASTPGGAPNAVTLMRRAVELAPGREDYRLNLARSLLMQGDLDSATTSFAHLVGRSAVPEIRELARRGLADVAAARARREARASAALPPEPTTAPPAAAAPRDTASPAAATQGASIPVLRKVAAGETRVLGTFTSVECRPGAIVLRIDAADGPVRMAAPDFRAVEFLTYRAGAPGSVACGIQQPAYRVLATFHTETAAVPGTDTANRVVAIELLPDGYTPR